MEKNRHFATSMLILITVGSDCIQTPNVKRQAIIYKAGHWEQKPEPSTFVLITEAPLTIAPTIGIVVGKSRHRKNARCMLHN